MSFERWHPMMAEPLASEAESRADEDEPQCPECGSPLEEDDEGLFCPDCGHED